jgi:ABC-type multidrug transport system permease subunit
LASLATTVVVIVTSVRQGLIIAWAIFGVVKIVVVVIFVALLLLILYLLLTQRKVSPEP